MTRRIFIFGAIAGAITIAIMSIGIATAGNEPHGEGFFSSQVFGYLIMLLALSVIFVAVKSYRDNDRGGYIKFLPAFGMGLGIAAVAGVVYVIGWEIYLAVSGGGFIEDYVAAHIGKMEAAGASAEAIAAEREKMDGMVKMYANPLFRMPITFTEIFPVGLLVALISAAILRKPEVLPAR